MTATAQQLEYLKNSIQSIQDYPKPGILFRDVTSLLEDPKAYALSIELLAERYKDAGLPKWWAPRRVASYLAHRLRWRWA
jgi:adenine phosphoribosyltransferase